MLLDNDLRQALVQEVAAYARHIPDPQAQSICVRLQSVLEAGEITEEILGPLGHVLSVSLESGRLRRLYGPHVEMQAERLFAQTPQGLEMRTVLEQCNQALEAIKGQTIQQIALALKGPGKFYLQIDTDRCRLRFLINRGGVFPLDVETAS